MAPTPLPSVEKSVNKPIAKVYQVRLKEDKDASFFKDAKPVIEGLGGEIMRVYADIHGFVYRIPIDAENPLDGTKAPWNDAWIHYKGTVTETDLKSDEGLILFS